ncbi:MAG: YiiX/YebB-like N1pC/P60 family cysteine hydrolase [Bacteroidales bacterium]|nr:YiiX/YebB-like N1pC/P60 family cysteine hydrolase [Bacteroidales bacterium]MDD4822589.1 YiiX/YebB-like N1pC/P60 family cysteine hydrolase [Bacteroidales bacterium]
MRKLIFLILLLLLALPACKKSSVSPVQERFVNVSFQEGDLVFRRGSGIASRAVLTADAGGSYSHVGIIVKEGAAWKVIHITPGEAPKGEKDSVKSESLSQFFQASRAVCGAVLRFTGDPLLSKRAALEAMTVCRRKILFDHAYDLNDTTTMYCTELIRFVYLKAEVDLSGGKTERLHIPGFNGDYLFPSQILKSPFLREIERF